MVISYNFTVLEDGASLRRARPSELAVLEDGVL